MSWLDCFDLSFLPNGKSGPWRIERFTITKDGASRYNLGLLFTGGDAPARQVQPGKYVRLAHENRGVVMSNTPAEVRDHCEPWMRAKGRCLIHGLGLGMITAACLRKPEVEHVTVVEREEHVIKLVAKHLTKEFGADRIEIVHGSSLDWHPPRDARYGMVWHDIWDHITVANKPEMSKLHRRYGKLCDWQGSWGRWEIERMMKNDRRFGRPW